MPPIAEITYCVGLHDARFWPKAAIEIDQSWDFSTTGIGES